MSRLALLAALAVGTAAVAVPTTRAEDNKPPKEFTALFNGKDLAGWKGHTTMAERVKLKDKAEDVRVTTRLVDSPACLVVQDGGMSTQLARMLKQAGQTAPETKPVLEVNAEHALVKKLEGSVHFNDLAHILFDQALLAEGGLPADPAAYVKRVNALLV